MQMDLCCVASEKIDPPSNELPRLPLKAGAYYPDKSVSKIKIRDSAIIIRRGGG